MSAWPPAATRTGTAAYADRRSGRVADGHFRTLAGLTVSSIGLGTAHGECTDADDARYEDAAAHALAHGINLLDTAIHYRCGRSERALGRALRRSVETGSVARDQVVICTKGGTIPLNGPAATRSEYVDYVRRRYVEPGLCSPQQIVGGRHCMTPAFLRDQAATSLAKLGIDRVDVYLIDEPEAQLRAVDRAEFLARVRAAFETLEALCDDGRIAVFGVATWNGFRTPHDAREHLSLDTLAGLARDVAGTAHRFRVVQVPFNVAMPEALVADTQHAGGRSRSPLDAAAELGLDVVASSSLCRGGLARGLPVELRGALPTLASDAQRAIHFARSTPGIAAALVGMREPAHVRENLELVSIPPTPAAARRMVGP